MLARIAVIAALICSFANFLPAQRFVRTLRPPEEEELKFDTNLQPITNLSLSPGQSPSDLNYSPHMVFSQDSSRLFVVFPGSDRLVGWEIETGEIIADIEVPSNPASVTLGSDGTSLAIVSLFVDENFGDASTGFEGENIGAVSVVDLETFDIKTVNLEEVFFSFFNNVVFSPDLSHAYIASSLTDELLQLDLVNLVEAGPRIKFEGGTRPSAITLSPDETTLAVVLIGSNELPRNEVPDSIQLIDLSTFTISRSIVPDPIPIDLGDGNVAGILPDITGSNNLAFSSDGRWGMIAERSASTGSILPEFSSDAAFLIDMETGEVDEIFSVGGVPSLATLVPDSQTFCVVSAGDATFINYETRSVTRTQERRSQFRTTSRPGFIGDQILLGSPVRDAIVRFDMRTNGMRKIARAGMDWESENLTIPAGALDVSISPDGKTIATLLFNDNSIDLFQPTERFEMPEFVQDSDWLTGFALTNVTDDEVEIVAEAFNNVGFPFADIDECQTEEGAGTQGEGDNGDGEECENVIDLVNPKTLSLQPREQVSFTPLGLIEAIPGIEVEGWLDLDIDSSKLAGLFLSLDGQVTRMDGGRLYAEGALRQVITHFRVTDGFVSRLVVLNSNLATSDIVIQLLGSDGAEVAATSVPVAPSGRINRLVLDPNANETTDLGLFPPDTFEEDAEYYLLVTTPVGMSAYVRYFNDKAMAILEGTPTAGPGQQRVDRQIAPQVVAFGGNSSILTLISAASEEATMTLTFYPAEGLNLPAVEPVEMTLTPGQMIKEDVAELFGLEDQGAVVSGWVDVTSDQVGIFGSVEFQLFDGQAMTILPFFPAGSESILFAHVAQGLGFSTGMVLLNPTDTLATLDVTLRGLDGMEVTSVQLVLAPGERLAPLIEELFDEEIEQIGGSIELTADVPVIAIEVFFSDDGEILSAVPGNTISQ